MAWISWSLRQAEFSSSCSHSSSSSHSWGQDAVVRVSARQRAWTLRTPVEQPSRMRKKCCYNAEELGVNMWQSVLLQLTSHTYQHQPFRNSFENKVWEVYFSKEVCSFAIIVYYVSACICIHIVVSWLYNTIQLWILFELYIFSYLFLYFLPSRGLPCHKQTLEEGWEGSAVETWWLLGY